MIAPVAGVMAPAVFIGAGATAGAAGETTNQLCEGKDLDPKSILIAGAVGGVGAGVGIGADKVLGKIAVNGVIASTAKGAVVGAGAAGASKITGNILEDKPIGEGLCETVAFGAGVGAVAGAVHGHSRKIHSQKSNPRLLEEESKLMDKTAKLEEQETRCNDFLKQEEDRVVGDLKDRIGKRQFYEVDGKKIVPVSEIHRKMRNGEKIRYRKQGRFHKVRSYQNDGVTRALDGKTLTATQLKTAKADLSIVQKKIAMERTSTWIRGVLPEDTLFKQNAISAASSGCQTPQKNYAPSQNNSREGAKRASHVPLLGRRVRDEREEPEEITDDFELVWQIDQNEEGKGKGKEKEKRVTAEPSVLQKTVQIEDDEEKEKEEESSLAPILPPTSLWQIDQNEEGEGKETEVVAATSIVSHVSTQQITQNEAFRMPKYPSIYEYTHGQAQADQGNLSRRKTKAEANKEHRAQIEKITAEIAVAQGGRKEQLEAQRQRLQTGGRKVWHKEKLQRLRAVERQEQLEIQERKNKALNGRK